MSKKYEGEIARSLTKLQSQKGAHRAVQDMKPPRESAEKSIHHGTKGWKRACAKDAATPVDQADRIVAAIAHRLALELDRMREIMDDGGGRDAIDAISAEMNSQLATIRGLIAEGRIRPQHNLRLSRGATQESPCDRPLRVGVFPIAANPIHWMHLCGGLQAMALYRLDKVVYVIAGSDARKPGLLRADVRHRMAEDVLRLFSPLFAYSPVALDNAMDGETSIFRILELNPRQKVDGFYIAGTDHRNRYYPETGKPDTIQKLEDGIRGKIFGYDERMNSISMIFVGRGEGTRSGVETFLTIESVEGMLLETSSTSIRRTLAGHGALEKLATLPFSVFKRIRKSGLYSRLSRGS